MTSWPLAASSRGDKGYAMNPKNQSPRTATRGQKKSNQPVSQSTTTDAEAQALRLAVRRFSRSKNYLRGSLAEGKETLALLKSHPAPEAVAHIARQELRVLNTAKLLEETEVALAVFYRLYLVAKEGWL